MRRAAASSGADGKWQMAHGKWNGPWQGRTPMVKDPVCGMMIDEKTAVGKSEYQGQTYYFCAAVCKQRFDQSPQTYVHKDR
jgi:Cu+-exporting ATPase